jgi:DNA primase catalytic core
MDTASDPGDVTDLADWRAPLTSTSHVHSLGARTAVVLGDIAAHRGRAQTSEAILRPARPARDPELVQIHAEAGRFYQACLAGSWVPGYLAARGLDAALLPTSPWKIGYAPASWTILTEHLRGLGHCDAALLCSGLAVNGKNGQLRDHFHDRLMIPLRTEDGYVTGFIGRRHPDAGDDHGPKYLNSPDTEIFTKGQILAGLAEARNALRQGAQPVLTEGPLDAIGVSIAAPAQYTGLAPCGTALTGDQVAALARTTPLADRGVLVAFDGDTAGKNAAVRAYSLLAPVTSSLTTITFPDGTDPASLLQTGGSPALHDALTGSARPLADLVIDTRIEDWAHGRELVFTELQIGALRAAAGIIATMPPDHAGPQAARLCALFAERYGWKPQEVTTVLIDAIERHYLAGMPAIQPSPWAAWTAVNRAIAPPRQPTDCIKSESPGQRPRLTLVRPASRGRELADYHRLRRSACALGGPVCCG